MTKVEPFVEDFEDGNYAGWSVNRGTGTASNGALKSTNGSTCYVYRSQTNGDLRVRFKFQRNSGTDAGSVWLRHADPHNRVQIWLKSSGLELEEGINGVGHTRQTNSNFGTATGTWYEAVVECEGKIGRAHV